jgi:hypothetical protein
MMRIIHTMMPNFGKLAILTRIDARIRQRNGRSRAR